MKSHIRIIAITNASANTICDNVSISNEWLTNFKYLEVCLVNRTQFVNSFSTSVSIHCIANVKVSNYSYNNILTLETYYCMAPNIR